MSQQGKRPVGMGTLRTDAAIIRLYSYGPLKVTKALTADYEGNHFPARSYRKLYFKWRASFPAFLSPDTIRLIRTFEELSFNRLKH